jgi:putative membrane protein
MFIDYVTLMLINMTAGLVTLSLFLWKGLDRQDNAHWAPAFLSAGLIAVVCGLAMTFTSPLPRPYSMVFGEMSVCLGVLFAAAAWALAKGWCLRPLGIYAFFAGAAAITVGIRIIDLSLTMKPGLSGAGFILTGLGGVFAWLILWQYKVKLLRIAGAVVLLAAAAIWALTGYAGYWGHMVTK